MREAAETKRNLRKENERLRSEYERKLRELNDFKQYLKNEVEMLRNRKGSQDVGKERARLRAENNYMRERLQVVEGERDKLNKQLTLLCKDSGQLIGDVENAKTDGKVTGTEKSDIESSESCLETTAVCSPKTAVQA